MKAFKQILLFHHTFMSAKKLVAFSALLIGLFFIAIHYGFGQLVDLKVARPISFAVRHALGRNPSFDPRLKILIYDDLTASELNASDFTLDQWRQLLFGIGQSKPKVIIIDKIFARPYSDGSYEQLASDLRSSGVNVVVGGFSAPPIAGTTPLSETWNEALHLERVFKDLDPVETRAFVQSLPVSMQTSDVTKPKLAFGPTIEMHPALAGVGSLVYEGNSNMQLFIRVGENLVLPHAGLFAADSIAINDGILAINQHNVPLIDHNQIALNLTSKSDYYKHTFSLRSTIRELAREKPPSAVKKGDVVLILPLMYTGNTDWVSTSFDQMPGGFVITSVINSVMTGQWLRVFESDFVVVLTASLMAAIGAAILAPLYFLIFTVANTLFLTTSGLLVFLYGNTLVPWVPAIIYFLTAGTLVFLEKMRCFANRARGIQLVLGGVLSQERIDAIVANPSSLVTDPISTEVSIMFIDIIGFSKSAESQSPQEVFESLRSVFSQIGKIIQMHGGIIDKTLGDGVLAYFGYQLDGRSGNVGHADAALAAATAIQRQMVDRNSVLSLEQAEKMLRLRIGINTGQVFLGNVGDTQRIEITLIGHAVNTAQRLEAGCEPYHVMIGADTANCLQTKIIEGVTFQERSLSIKHKTEFVEAFDVDPVSSMTEKMEKIESLGRELSKKSRAEKRVAMSQKTQFKLASPQASGYIVNYSISGLGILLDRYFSVNTVIIFELKCSDPLIQEQLHRDRLDVLTCELRWGRPVKNGFLHGATIKNLSGRHLADINQILAQGSMDSKPESA